MSKLTLRRGDCLDLVKRIRRNSVNLVLTDLPYGTTGLGWDCVIDPVAMWEQIDRVLIGNSAVVLFCAQPFTTQLIASKLDWFKYCWIWEKTRKGDVFNAKNKPMRAHEEIAVFSRGTTANGSDRKMPYYPQGLVECKRTARNTESRRAFFDKRPSHKETYTQEKTGYPGSVLKFANENGTIHPTQKPLALVKYLIETYTLPGETVLDLTMGSGTTGVACVETDRDFIGFEQDEKHYTNACARIVSANDAQG